MMRCWLLPALLPVLILCGCSFGSSGSYQPQPVKEPEPIKLSAVDQDSLFPLALGSVWRYDLELTSMSSKGQNQGQGTMSWKVIKFDEQNGRKRAIIEVTINDEVDGQLEFEVDDTGVYQVAATSKGSRTTFEPRYPILRYPVEPDQEFVWSGQGVLPGGGKGQSKVTSRVAQPMPVDTATESLNAVGVESNTVFANGKSGSSSTTFFAPDRGMVRYAQNVTRDGRLVSTLAKLKQYIPGK